MRALALAFLLVSRTAGAATFLAEIQTGPIWLLPPVVTPDGLFAYSDLGAFQRAPDGTLAELQSYDAGLGSSIDVVLGSADGGFVYISTSVSGIGVFQRDTLTGQVTLVENEPGSPIFPFRDPDFLAVSPDGTNLYATTSGSLLTYTRDPMTGALTFLNEIEEGSLPGEIPDLGGGQAILVSPDNAHVYVAGDELFAFERTPPNGALSLVAIYGSLPGFSSLVTTADGLDVYAGTRDRIARYVRNPTTGELTFASFEPASVRAGLEKFTQRTESLHVSTDGTRLVGLVQNFVVVYDRDAGTGALELVTVERIPSKEVSMSADGVAVYAGAKAGSVHALATLDCTPAPALGCHAPAASKKSALSIKDSTPSDDKLTWRSTPAGLTDLAEFGDPITGGDDVVFCLYDASPNPQPLLDAVAPARGTCEGEPCWELSSNGNSLKYKDDDGLPSGIQKLSVRERAVDHGAVKLKAKSLGLALPVLPLTPPIRAQLQSRTGACWDSAYSLPRRNDDTRFTAKSD